MNIVGLDFDNTLIDYDALFYRTALEQNLIPKINNQTKSGVRNYLLNIGSEDKFTKLQGEVYGTKIKFAESSNGVFEFLKSLKKKGYIFYIVSHKTKYPIIGPKHDLHQAALSWLEKNNFIVEHGLNIKKENIFFEPTKEKKVERIHSIKCDYFIDDLKEILNMINNKTIKILYDKNLENTSNSDFYKFNNWSRLSELNIF